MRYRGLAKTPRNHGAASFFAVAALGVVAAGVLAMITMLRIDHRRTESTAIDAQLRQLLLAGSAAVEINSNKPIGRDNWSTVALPQSLAEAGANVRWKRIATGDAEPDQAYYTIQADYADRSAHQILQFAQDANTNSLIVVGAELHP